MYVISCNMGGERSQADNDPPARIPTDIEACITDYHLSNTFHDTRNKYAFSESNTKHYNG